jgi:cell division transport system permease protein
VKLGWISFVFLRVLKSLRELLWTHVLTSGTMAMTLFIFGGFLLIQDNLHTLLKGWGSQIQIFAYLNQGLAAAELQKLTATVRSYPEVESVRFVSREQAWESFKKSMGSQSGLLEGLQAEILPPSLEIVLKVPYRERAPAGDVAKRLRGLAGISQVEYPEEWVEKLGVLVLGVQWAKWIFGGFLFAATLLIVGNTVKLAILARKDEIEIMQLVGAPEGLIQAPFVVEGMIQGIAGASLSLLLLWLLFLFLGTQLPNFLGIFAVRDQVHFLDVQGMGLMLSLGWLLGACGSLFSLRRFLKV